MISASEMEKGLTLDIEGEPYTVLDWQHVTAGRGKAKVHVSQERNVSRLLALDGGMGNRVDLVL